MKCGFINFKLNGQTRYNSPNEFSFSINNCKIPKVVAAKDLGLIISESLNWSEHIQSRIAKGTKTLFLLKRNTSFLINEKSKSYLYRATINPTLLYASECWTANISDMKAIESFNKKVMLWINPNLSYFECLVTNNLLPPMYFQVLKDLLLYRKILDGKYNVSFENMYSINENSRTKKIILPRIVENQRQDFGYRTGYRINHIQHFIDFINSSNLKSVLLDMMWSYFKRFKLMLLDLHMYLQQLSTKSMETIGSRFMLLDLHMYLQQLSTKSMETIGRNPCSSSCEFFIIIIIIIMAVRYQDELCQFRRLDYQLGQLWTIN